MSPEPFPLSGLAGEPARAADAALKLYGNSSTLEFSPLMIAVAEVQPSPAAVGFGGIWKISDGSADLATNGETQLLRFSLEDPNLRVILTVAEGYYRIAARRSSGIRTLADLRGKRITTPLDTTAHWFLLEMLKSANLKEDDVVLVAITPWGEQVEALAKGDVDAMAMWEPEPHLAKERLGDDVIFFQDRSGYRELFNLHASAKSLANPETRAPIVSFIREVLAATHRLNENPARYFPSLAVSSKISEGHIASVWQEFTFSGHIAPELLEVLVEQEDWLSRRENRPRRARSELASLIDASVLREAMDAMR